MGLSIAKHLVEAHGGEIRVASEGCDRRGEGRGTIIAVHGRVGNGRQRRPGRHDHELAGLDQRAEAQRQIAHPQPRHRQAHAVQHGKLVTVRGGKGLGDRVNPQDLRARHVGEVVVDSAVDRPWSQYFCCMLTSNREFVRNYPAATKRVLRAILKPADFCAAEPAQAARAIVDRGFTPSYPYALDALSKLPYNLWREWDPDDTLRFYALRLREAGLIKSSPQKIIADGTDWRFLDELKRELKA